MLWFPGKRAVRAFRKPLWQFFLEDCQKPSVLLQPSSRCLWHLTQALGALCGMGARASITKSGLVVNKLWRTWIVCGLGWKKS